MKRRDLEQKLLLLGWFFHRHGRAHDIWSNGEESEAVPRHSEINEYTAKGILKRAIDAPGPFCMVKNRKDDK